MAKSRKDRNGVVRYQVTVWIKEATFKAAQRKMEQYRKKTGLINVTESGVCSSILEEVLK